MRPVLQLPAVDRRLEVDLLDLPMAERLLRAAARLEQAPAPDEGAHGHPYLLRREQAAVFGDFASYAQDVARRRADGRAAFCRIILPPRTGKTVIAGHIIARAGLTSVVIVPTRALVHQTARMLRQQLPGVPVGLFAGADREVVEHGVNIVTYSMLQRWPASRLPLPLRTAGLVFADEAHHATTGPRMRALRESFAPGALRVALTATPDYDAWRRLDRFFPELVHEISLAEALELELLAPMRAWVAEVDVDGSRVHLVSGDYQRDMLGRLMSSAPFFRSVEVFRYGAPEADIPALITCATRQQAYDLHRYLTEHRPAGSPEPALILGETPGAEREESLGRFERGSVDTLIQVGVLTEGWNSPRCKLLIDLAPTASRVRATQKYFRVLTRHGDAEARVYVLLPKDLPRPPVLPPDLFGGDLEEYACGTRLGAQRADGRRPAPIERHGRTPVAGVELKQRILLSTRLDKPRLDRENVRQIRRVLESCPGFDPSNCGRFRFRALRFEHRLFHGGGDFLLQWLRVPSARGAFEAFLARVYPELAASRMLAENGGLEPERSCADDVLEVESRMARQVERGRRPAEELVVAWKMLGGRAEPALQPDEPLLLQEREAYLRMLMGVLKPRNSRILARRFGLSGGPELTLDQIGELEGVTRERVRQVVLVSLRKLQRTWRAVA